MASTGMLTIFFIAHFLANHCLGAPTTIPPSPTASCKLMKPVLQQMACTEELMLEHITEAYDNGAGCGISGMQELDPSLTSLNVLLQLLSDVEAPHNKTLEIIASLNEILHGNSIPECLQLEISSGDASDFAGIEGQEICILDRMRSVLKTFYTELVFFGHTECPSSYTPMCNRPNEEKLNNFTQLICSNFDDYELSPYCNCSDCNSSSPVSLFEDLLEWISLTQNSSYEILRHLSSTLNSSILPHLQNLVDNDCSGFELPDPDDSVVDVPTNLSANEESQGCLVERLNIIFGFFYNEHLHFKLGIVESQLALCASNNNNNNDNDNDNDNSVATAEAQSQQDDSSVYNRYQLSSRLTSHFGRK